MSEAPDQPVVPDVAELVESLKRRVAERRERGEYPRELTTELRAHFERVKRNRPVTNLEHLEAQLDVMDALGWFSAEKIVLASPRPGARMAHALVARAVARQTQGVLEQVQLFGDAVREAMRTVLAALEEPQGHVHDDLLGQVDALQEQMAELQRGPVGAAADAALRARLEAVEAAIAAGRFPSVLSNERFARLGRAPSPDVMRAWGEELEGASPVLDIGSSESSFQKILRDLGVEATGIEAGRSVAHLLTVPDGYLGGIAAVVGAEALSVQEIATIVTLARDKVRAGGRVLVGTTPLHPAYLRILFEDAGFATVDVRVGLGAPEEQATVATR